MGIELSPACLYDYLEIFDGADSSAPQLVQRLCGSVPPVDAIVSSGNSMFIRFVSDSSVAGEGFISAYQEVIGESVNSNRQLMKQFLIRLPVLQI